jgi:rSAM/selenodomain-associated transferase 1
MSKVPEPGKVKTRLTPPLTPAEAAQLNSCFLRDTADAIEEATREGGAKGVGVYTPMGREAAYADIFPQGFVLVPQREGDFGARLFHAVADLLACGFQSVCLIDSDSPTITPAVLREAVALLRGSSAPLVLGPSRDGGYYLIGLTNATRKIFQDIDWSTDRVFQQTCERARQAGLAVEILPECYDVDDASSLAGLCEDLLGQTTSAAPATRAFLESIVAREGRARIWPP